MLTVPVLVAGGGPVGLTLALCLANRGIRCVLVEIEPGAAAPNDPVEYVPSTVPGSQHVAWRGTLPLDDDTAARVVDRALGWSGG